VARRLQPSRQRPQRPDTVTVKNSHTRLDGRTAQHTGGIGADRSRTPVRQGHHQEQDAVHPPELVSGHHQTEQGMGRSRYPHLAGQHGTQMLQSVGVTSGTGKTHLLIALGTTAAEQGRRVRYLTCAQLVNELAEAADDKQLSRVVGRYARIDLLCLDLCGHGDYAEAAAVVGSRRCGRGFGLSA
jgi:hypothetical protein